MAFDKIKTMLLTLCSTILVGATAYAMTPNSSIRIGIFNTQKATQSFYESLPQNLRNDINRNQLWLNATNSHSGFTQHQLEITDLTVQQANDLCDAVNNKNAQCLSSIRKRWPLQHEQQTSKPTPPPKNINFQFKTTNTSLFMLQPLAPLKTTKTNANGFDTHLAQSETTEETPHEKKIISYNQNFTITPSKHDTPEIKATKEMYNAARNRFINMLRQIGNGVNEGEGSEAARAELIAVGRELFEVAGNTYLSGFLEREIGQAKILSQDAGAGETFIHHVQNNIDTNARHAIRELLDDLISNASGAREMDDEIVRKTIDRFIVSGAQNLIDAGLSAARRSDLYALRNMELDYNLNNFEDSYFSALITQPIYQSPDLRHNIFLQGGGIINEQSVDIDDDENRHTLNIGAAYRYLTVDEKYLLGGNIFFDHQWPYNHSRMSVGIDAKAKNLNLAANYYYPLTDFRDSRTDSQGVQYEERALEGYDLELGYTPPFLPDMSVFGKGYQYFRETDDDIRGLELSAEYNIRDNFVLKGALIEENGGRDGFEVGVQYRIPLYDTDNPNLALASIKTAAGNDSMRSNIFNKVRRENRIRVEERVKANEAETLITAQFNASSIGLPFIVGTAATGAGVNLPFDTTITVPNGDFGIINFSNGAIANISASGGGDVILEFNNTTLTVTTTNGGFVQFISGSGGINTINVPGGTVNLLGTDIDVTDDGTTTTIQVRAGQIEVVPDVGVAALNANQADIVSLSIASGATSLLVNPALETRQEAAFTNLDFINPDPPVDTRAAPFINLLPTLITGPQFIGNNADLRLTFTQAVTVSGSPFINGLVDTNARTFTYDAIASSPTQLVFRHTFIASDVGATAITIQNLNLNGGTIIGTSNTLNAVTAYTDTVVPINDTTAPSLTSSTPVDNEPAFNSGSDIILNFDENMVANIGNITLTDTTDGSSSTLIPIGDAQVSITGSTVTINPTGVLDLATDYDLVIGSDVLRDTAGNAFAGIATTQLNFTTSNDITPPALTATTPANSATSVARTANIVLSFDDNAIIGSGNITIHRTADNAVLETIAVGSANVTGGGTATITINPTNDLPAATQVYILIPSTAFEDINGNDFAGITATTDLSFRTFSPLDLSNLTLWLDGTDLDGDGAPEGASESGITAGEITTWVNKAGGGNATSSTGSRPQFANPGAQFVGTTNSSSAGDFMQIAGGGASGRTIIFVLEGVTQNVSGNVNALLDSAGRDYTFLRVINNDYKMSFDGATNREGQFSIDGATGFVGPGENVGAPGPFPADALLYAEYTTLPTNHEILGGLSTGNTPVDTTPDFRSNMIVREVIMYSDTKTSGLAGIDEREQVEGYLAHKYGITARLPSGHPFKTVSP